MTSLRPYFSQSVETGVHTHIRWRRRGTTGQESYTVGSPFKTYKKTCTQTPPHTHTPRNLHSQTSPAPPAILPNNKVSPTQTSFLQWLSKQVQQTYPYSHICTASRSEREPFKHVGPFSILTVFNTTAHPFSTIKVKTSHLAIFRKCRVRFHRPESGPKFCIF